MNAERVLFRKFSWAALLLFASVNIFAQEVMLGVHGGNEVSSTPGAVSVVDQSDASFEIVGNPVPGIGMTGVATSSSGQIFAITGSANAANDGPHLIEIDPATGGLLNDIGRMTTALGNDCYLGDLSFQPGTDILFAVAANQGDNPRCDQESSSGGLLVTIDTTTAEVTVIGRDQTLGNSNGGIAFAADGTLYFTPCWSTDSVLLTIDPATAGILTTTPLDSDTCYMGLAVRPSDGTLFASYDWESDESVMVTLDPQTGDETLLGLTEGEIIHDLTFTDGLPLAPVAEPVPGLSWMAMITLFVLVLMLTALYRRRLSH
jgi:sugar lactone lactonase YvrE